MSKSVVVTEGQIYALLANNPELLSDMLKHKSVGELQEFARAKAAETLIGGTVDLLAKKFADGVDDDFKSDFVKSVISIAEDMRDGIKANSELNRGKKQNQIGFETPSGYVRVSLLYTD